jgi:microsomal dipeptidase-like Zn-dependent dipeptidase
MPFTQTLGDMMTMPSYWNRLTPVGGKILECMMSLGIIVDVAHAHINTLVGLGTAGGGGLPAWVDAYRSILDLPKLVEAMDEVGFKGSEIEA